MLFVLGSSSALKNLVSCPLWSTLFIHRTFPARDRGQFLYERIGRVAVDFDDQSQSIFVPVLVVLACAGTFGKQVQLAGRIERYPAFEHYGFDDRLDPGIGNRLHGRAAVGSCKPAGAELDAAEESADDDHRAIQFPVIQRGQHGPSGGAAGFAGVVEADRLAAAVGEAHVAAAGRSVFGDERPGGRFIVGGPAHADEAAVADGLLVPADPSDSIHSVFGSGSGSGGAGSTRRTSDSIRMSLTRVRMVRPAGKSSACESTLPFSSSISA